MFHKLLQQLSRAHGSNLASRSFPAVVVSCIVGVYEQGNCPPLVIALHKGFWFYTP